uniref:Uncharacterized protein n=1 Tax=Graphocephala atropunctata TaxID=36148 RepID=A0A1B6MC62_9HEMI
MELLLCLTLGAVCGISQGAPRPATTEEVWVNPLEGVPDPTTEPALEEPPPTLVSGLLSYLKSRYEAWDLKTNGNLTTFGISIIFGIILLTIYFIFYDKLNG